MHDCSHELEEDRVFTGTWVSDELKKSIKKGYRIVEVFEIWQYRITQYNPKTREGGLFNEYIDTFLKIKQEASGWPRECVDDLSKDRYLEMYEREEGIRL
ncbi:DNA polymerase, partial [Enterobacter cloacae complex sp. 4DZ3-17B2]|uniref:DNA polymerase n=1 Tax=Enterobacter cloacae complex sp. 4DZ3-17B2 TaxID=2511990 RepID=UPI001CA51C97